jgi:hypothetical protein
MKTVRIAAALALLAGPATAQIHYPGDPMNGQRYQLVPVDPYAGLNQLQQQHEWAIDNMNQIRRQNGDTDMIPNPHVQW